MDDRLTAPIGRRSFLGRSGSLVLGFPLLARLQDETPPRLLQKFGERGANPGEFEVPIGIALNSRREIVVSDFRNDRIQRFGQDGGFLLEFEVDSKPSGLAFGPKGELFIAHFGDANHADHISVHDAEGKRLRGWGKSGKGDGEFDMPGGIAIGPGPRVYVADQTNRRVQVFDLEGKFLFGWGRYGVGEGEFGGNTPLKNRTGGPHFLAFDSESNLYTTEASVGRIQVFNSEGKFLRAWGSNDDKPGGFGGRPKNLPGPIGICIDKDDHVWVGATNHRIQQFTKEGVYLRGFGGKGSEPGNLNTPHALAVDDKGHLHVVDTLNSRIQIFQV